MEGTTNECGFPLFIRRVFQVRNFWLLDDLAEGEKAVVPLSGGLFCLGGCGAMRKFAPSPWAHKHKATSFGTSLSTIESNRAFGVAGWER
jgi:hypothetical protein